MPMDGFTLSFLQRELETALAGGRVDKVNQPERDALLMLVRSQGRNQRLLLSANASQARVQLTAQSFENPGTPPMFCMLMRKHLVGAKIMGIEQLGGDRLLKMTFEGIGEMGDYVLKFLYVELMGRYSNITLTDEKGTILDAIRHVNSDMSRVRVVLPGLPYELPPQQDKLRAEELTPEALAVRLAALSMPLDKALMDSVAGMATIIAREICARLGVDRNTLCSELNTADCASRVCALLRDMKEHPSPVLLMDQAGMALDFFPVPYTSYAQELQKPYPAVSEAMDAFYLGRDLHLRMQQKSAGLQRHIKSHMERLEKKRGIMLDTLQQSEQAEKDRIYGELLTANLHMVQKGQAEIKLPNYYEENQATVAIALDPQLTPSQNAQRYYKRYRKSKVAQQYAGEQIKTISQELELLENALEDLDKCTTATDLSEIRYLLTENGYLRPDPSMRRQKKVQEGKPYRFRSPGETEIIVGKNSLQNDRLTLHAKGNETWLHVQGMPGSHVIIRTESEADDDTLLLAAKLAAYFSKGRKHPMLPVDYTKRKYVKKAAGTPAGFVTYTNFKTILVSLSAEDMVQIEKQSARQA